VGGRVGSGYGKEFRKDREANLKKGGASLTQYGDAGDTSQGRGINQEARADCAGKGYSEGSQNLPTKKKGI